MSFLIVQNGLLVPHVSSPTSPSRGIPNVSPISELKKIEEFQSVLNAEVNQQEGAPKSLRAVEVYHQSSKFHEEQRKRIYAKDIMTSPVMRILERAPAKDAAKMLERYVFRHLPVVNEQQFIVGMISDREIYFNREEKNKTCSDIMVHKIIVGVEQASIHEIAVMLLTEKINALPIINHKLELTGIITLSDILKFVIKSTPFLGNG